MFYIYILRSKIGRYYIGSTKDIKERFKEHNSGRVRSTKRFIPWQLLYTESFTDLKEARKREAQIKLWKSRKAIEKLFKKHF